MMRRLPADTDASGHRFESPHATVDSPMHDAFDWCPISRSGSALSRVFRLHAGLLQLA